MTTLALLVEQIRRVLSGGRPTDEDRVRDPEIRHAVIASCESALSLSSLNVNYNLDGGSIPDGSMIATYEGDNAVQLTRGAGNYCRAALPAQPMMLPERVGVFAVYPSGRPQEAFMFVPPGIINLWNDVTMLNPINEIMMTAESKYVEIYSDLIGAGIATVDMKLCVVDIKLLGDYDPLPISASMENAVVTEVLQRFGVEPKTVRKEGKEASPE